MQNDRAESPIEVMLYLMVFILVMTGVVFFFGPIVDGFVNQFTSVQMSVSPLFQGMMANPLKWANCFFLVLVFFCAVMLVWAVKTVIRKHRYSRPEDVYMEEYL